MGDTVREAREVGGGLLVECSFNLNSQPIPFAPTVSAPASHDYRQRVARLTRSEPKAKGHPFGCPFALEGTVKIDAEVKKNVRKIRIAASVSARRGSSSRSISLIPETGRSGAHGSLYHTQLRGNAAKWDRGPLARRRPPIGRQRRSDHAAAGGIKNAVPLLGGTAFFTTGKHNLIGKSSSRSGGCAIRVLTPVHPHGSTRPSAP